LIQVSSLAARVPALSAYAASKAEGEEAALRHADRMSVAVVRPPAVYGPHDRSTLPILRGLERGWLLHPAGAAARFSMLYASDLAALIVALLASPPRSGTIVEPDDGTAGGYGWSDLAAIAADRLARRVRTLAVPRGPLALMAGLSERVAVATGGAPLLSRGKLAELFHPDWVCKVGGMAAIPGWQPRTRFGDGLSATLGWYREAGWL
jgi:nucleoside-diphosphate-sugar epimerase